MNEGQMAFSQVMAHGSRFVLDRCIRRYDGNRRVRSSTFRDQYLAMSFAQRLQHQILGAARIAGFAGVPALAEVGDMATQRIGPSEGNGAGPAVRVEDPCTLSR